MTDLNDLWETARPVQPGGGTTAGTTGPRQPQQQPNTTTVAPVDEQWNAAKPVNPDYGSTAVPVTAPDATSAPHDPSWAEAGKAMVDPRKIKESLAQMGQDIVEGGSKAVHDLVADPLGDIDKRLKRSAKFLGSPGLSFALPFMNEEMQAKVKQVMGGAAPEGDPIVQALIERYGSLDKLRNTMFKDPGGTWLDIASIFAGGESLAARGAAQGVRGAGTTAKIAGIGARLDPITLAARGIPEIGLPGLESVASKAIPKTLGWRSGVGPEVITDIKDIHKPGSESWNKYGEEGPKDFNDAFKGNVTPRQVVDRAEQGIDNMRSSANLGYGLNKDEWLNAGGKLDMSVIDQAENDMRASLHTSGGSSLLSEEQRKSFTKMQEIIDEFRKRGPGGWTVEEMDALKRNLNKISVPLGDRELLRVRTALSNSVKDNILANASGTKYHESMGQYQAAMTDLDEMKSALSLGKDAPQHTVMSKLQSILRNNAATQYGTRQGLFDLLEKEGGVRLKPWLLGMATNVDAPRGITGAIAGGGGGGAGLGAATGMLLGGPGGAAAGAGAGAILGIPMAMADMYARSPRVAARVGRTMGEHGDAFSEAFPLARYGAYSTGHENREEDEKKRQHKATGGTVRKAAFSRYTR